MKIEQTIKASSHDYEDIDRANRERYIESEIGRQFDSYLSFHVPAILIFSVAMAVVEFTQSHPDLRYLNIVARFLVVFVVLAVVGLFREQPAKVRAGLFFAEQLMVLGYSAILFRKYHLNLSMNGNIPEIYMVVQFVVVICISPFIKTWSIFIPALLYSAVIVALGFYSDSSGIAFTLLSIGACVIAAIIRESFMKILRLKHGIDYDLRRRLLPRAYVQKTMATARKDLASAVRLQSTGILCIACDWRGFNEAVDREGAPVVMGVLSEYFDECVNMMHKFFPEGDASIDWMADEFLIYIPYNTQNAAEISDVVRASVEFAHELAQLCQAFQSRYGCPKGIDLGIALGRACYGLSGTSNSRRMLSFGYPVSLARAIQYQVKKNSLSDPASFKVAVSADVASILPTTYERDQAKGDRFLTQMGVDCYYVLRLHRQEVAKVS